MIGLTKEKMMTRTSIVVKFLIVLLILGVIGGVITYFFILDREPKDNTVPRHTVTLGINMTQAGTVSGAGSMEAGTKVTIRAVANYRYEFVRWTRNNVTFSTNAEHVLEVSGNITLMAVFRERVLDVALSSNFPNAGILTGTGSFERGTQVTVSAVANYRYEFVNWTRNNVVISEQVEHAFEISEHTNLVAVFQRRIFDVTLSSNIPNAGVLAGNGSFERGSTTDISAIANDGFRFIHWLENGEIFSWHIIQTVSFDAEHRSFVAIFEEVAESFNLNLSSNVAGAGSLIGWGNFEHGTQVTVTATANPGYEFVGWMQGGTTVSLNPSYTFYITSHTNLEAVFSITLAQRYAINYAAELNAGVPTVLNFTTANTGYAVNLATLTTFDFHFARVGLNEIVVVGGGHTFHIVLTSANSLMLSVNYGISNIRFTA